MPASNPSLEAVAVQHIEAEEYTVVGVSKDFLRNGAKQREIAPFVEAHLTDRVVNLDLKLAGGFFLAVHGLVVFCHLGFSAALGFASQGLWHVEVDVASVKVDSHYIGIRWPFRFSVLRRTCRWNGFDEEGCGGFAIMCAAIQLHFGRVFGFLRRINAYLSGDAVVFSPCLGKKPFKFIVGLLPETFEILIHLFPVSFVVL